jgi:hypothetical protein
VGREEVLVVDRWGQRHLNCWCFVLLFDPHVPPSTVDGLNWRLMAEDDDFHRECPQVANAMLQWAESYWMAN